MLKFPLPAVVRSVPQKCLGIHSTLWTKSRARISTSSTVSSKTKPVRPVTAHEGGNTPPPDQPFPAPYHHARSATPRSPFTKWILASPSRTAFLLKMGDWLGYRSPKQLAATRSKAIYEICSDVAAGPERRFWYEALSLPPSFQTWFLITNLHVWLVTVRLRALPPPHGRAFIQALLDHFFFDVEDRVRAVLGKKAPERLVTRHMKILREQWAGIGVAFDHAFITDDKDMASAIWRNLLGARGARGITNSDPAESLANTQAAPMERNMEEYKDQPSGGISDFEGDDVKKYVLYPQLMLTLTGYLRRELIRLENVSDADILGSVVRVPQGGVPDTRVGNGLRNVIGFGKVQDAARKIGIEAGVFERIF